MTVYVASARIKAIAHATEDVRKIVRAFQRVCQDERLGAKVEKSVVKGHFGNPITTLTVTLSGHAAGSFFLNMWKMLSRSDRETLIGEIHKKLDEQGRLHLRLDKQACFLGTIALQDQDPVKVEVDFRGFSDSPEQIEGFLGSINETAELPRHSPVK